MFYPGAKRKDASKIPHGGIMPANKGLVLHVQEGNNSPYGWFMRDGGKASSTWWVSKKGVVEQYVDADKKAWAQGSGNSQYNSVETEGFVREALTDQQLNALAELYAWGNKTYGWPLHLSDSPGAAGLGWHGMGAPSWGHAACPGSIRKGQRADVLARAAQILDPVAPDPIITTTDLGDVNVTRTDFVNIKLGKDGSGWTFCDVDHNNIVSIKQHGSYPRDDGYWPIARFATQTRAIDGHKSVIEIVGGGSGQVLSFSVFSV